LGVSGSASTLSFLGVENLRGNIRDDTFKFANGAKITGRIDGSAGSDTLDDSAFTTGVSVNMVAGTATGTAGIAALENVIGGSGADVVVGNSADNILIGNAGDDLLSARDGNDVLDGGDGNDKLDDISPPQPGVAEHNVLIGGRGADTLRGFGGKEELM